MTDALLTVLILGAISYALKSAGPLLLGGERALPAWLDRTAVLLPAPLIAALVASSTFVSDRQLSVDARAVGLAVAAVALWRKAPFIVVVLLAAAGAALTRQLA